MGLSRNYHHFAKVIAQGPATGHDQCVGMVLGLIGSDTPELREQVSVWWHQWVTMRDAMKSYFEAKKAEATVKVLTAEAHRQALDEALPLTGNVLPLGLPLFDQITPVARRPEGEPPAPATDA